MAHFSVNHSPFFSTTRNIRLCYNGLSNVREMNMSKTLMRDTVIKREIKEADGALYRYSLIMSESNKVASYKIPLYSIEIEMTDEDGNKTHARTRELFADVGKALSFFKKLADNLATPLNLPYIIEDEMR